MRRVRTESGGEGAAVTTPPTAINDQCLTGLLYSNRASTRGRLNMDTARSRLDEAVAWPDKHLGSKILTGVLKGQDSYFHPA